MFFYLALVTNCMNIFSASVSKSNTLNSTIFFLCHICAHVLNRPTDVTFLSSEHLLLIVHSFHTRDMLMPIEGDFINLPPTLPGKFNFLQLSKGYSWNIYRVKIKSFFVPHVCQYLTQYTTGHTERHTYFLAIPVGTLLCLQNIYIYYLNHSKKSVFYLTEIRLPSCIGPSSYVYSLQATNKHNP